jgi:hypothetical protein
MRYAVALMTLGMLLTACGAAAPTPTVDVRPTQTRAAEITQVAAIQATANAPTVTPIPTNTPVPTNTPIPPTSTPVPPTATATATRIPTPIFTATPRPPTATATPKPGAAPPLLTKEQAVGQFPVVIDSREIAKSPGSYKDKQAAFVGTILTIKVAQEGYVFTVNEFDTHAYLQVTLYNATTKTSDVTVFVLYDGDTTGMFEKSTVSIYGIGKGVHTFQNTYGGSVSQSLFYAQYIELNP